MNEPFSLMQESEFNQDQAETSGLSKKKRLKTIFGVRPVTESDGTNNCSNCKFKKIRNSGSYSGIKCLLMIGKGETGFSCPDLSDRKICNRYKRNRT